MAEQERWIPSHNDQGPTVFANKFVPYDEGVTCYWAVTNEGMARNLAEYLNALEQRVKEAEARVELLTGQLRHAWDEHSTEYRLAREAEGFKALADEMAVYLHAPPSLPAENWKCSKGHLWPIVHPVENVRCPECGSGPWMTDSKMNPAVWDFDKKDWLRRHDALTASSEPARLCPNGHSLADQADIGWAGVPHCLTCGVELL